MPGTPMKENEDSIKKLGVERPSNASYELPVRELTQTDYLNKKLLVSLLQRMNKSDGEFDKFIDIKDLSNHNKNEDNF